MGHKRYGRVLEMRRAAGKYQIFIINALYICVLGMPVTFRYRTLSDAPPVKCKVYKIEIFEILASGLRQFSNRNVIKGNGQ
jgi:hypothetical protein